MNYRKAVFFLIGAISMLSLWVVPNVSLNTSNIYSHFLDALNITKM